MRRRIFLIAGLAGAVTQVTAQQQLTWGGPVLDTHLHLRKDPDSCYAHMQGSGITNAVLLTQANEEARATEEAQRRPGIFVRSVAVDPSQADAEQVLRKALGGGAVSIGEIKYDLALDSPEMLRVYEIAAEMHAPVMMHIETYPKPYSTGYNRFDKVLKANPKTTFIGHGPLFWAHISAQVPADKGYPEGPVKPGGLTDRLLSDYPNLYADMSANSGRNALLRDREFARDFLKRQQDKLLFGSDCPCLDGKGAGVPQNRCIARATLEISQQLASSEVFRKITWTNGARLFRVAS